MKHEIEEENQSTQFEVQNTKRKLGADVERARIVIGQGIPLSHIRC